MRAVVRWLRPGRGVEVAVYTRRGCGLCAAAEELARREAGGATVRTVDVDADPVLRDRYDVLVPVVTVNGVEVATLEVRPGVIRDAVRSAGRAERGR